MLSSGRSILIIGRIPAAVKLFFESRSTLTSHEPLKKSFSPPADEIKKRPPPGEMVQSLFPRGGFHKV